MAGFVAGVDRGQTTLLPECLEDWVDENNSVRAVDVFVEALDLRDLGFEGVDAAGIGRLSYRPGVLLKVYIYGYLNRVQLVAHQRLIRHRPTHRIHLQRQGARPQ